MARRTFTTEFKTGAAKLVAEQGYTQRQAAQSLGFDPASIRYWSNLQASRRPELATGVTRG
jgi:transposase-like protein